MAAWRRRTRGLVLGGGNEHLRTAWSVRAWCTAAALGMVGDLFKMATNGLVRVVGDGNNHWPLVYDRDLADLTCGSPRETMPSGVFNANDEGDERVNDIVSAIGPYLPHRPDVRYVPIEEARSKMGPYADALALDQVVRSTRVTGDRLEPEPALGGGQRGATAGGVASRPRVTMVDAADVLDPRISTMGVAAPLPT